MPGIGGRLFKTRWVAQIYAGLVDHHFWSDRYLDLIEHFRDPSTGGLQILDLGVGTGLGTLALAEALGDRAQVLGVDFSEVMVARAQALGRGVSNVDFVHGDATDLHGIATDSMDYVVAHSFLYLIPDAQGALREARRVLKPSGRLIFMEPREEASLRQAFMASAGAMDQARAHPIEAIRLVAAMAGWRAMSRIEGRRAEPELTELFESSGFAALRFQPTLGGLGLHLIAE
jgi:ubiquinone/menaquinone biosynthesis C-methylase UbiE